MSQNKVALKNFTEEELKEFVKSILTAATIR